MMKIVRLKNLRNINISKFRCFSKFVVHKESDHFVLSSESDDFNAQVKFKWLRDHCRSPSMYNERTHQRKLDINDINLSSKPINYQINEKDLIIQWDDGHVSKFDWKWLNDNCNNNPASNFRYSIQEQLWSHQQPPDLTSASVDVDAYMSSDAGLRQCLISLIKYGFAVVSNAQPTMEATELVSKRIGPTMKTPFGESWCFTSDQPDDVSDSAYTSEALGPHNDGTYFPLSPGIQVFHCLKEAAEGGVNILVDGFTVAKHFKEDHPDGYKFLSETPLEAEYIHSESEPRHHFHHVDTIFKHHPIVKDRLIQIRYNIYDRAPHHLRIEDQQRLYRYLPLLAREVNNPKNFYYLSLKPGNVLLVNNWRVLHGRTAYSGGQRTMGGCYISRADIGSKARVLGLVL